MQLLPHALPARQVLQQPLCTDANALRHGLSVVGPSANSAASANSFMVSPGPEVLSDRARSRALFMPMWTGVGEARIGAIQPQAAQASVQDQRADLNIAPPGFDRKIWVRRQGVKGSQFLDCFGPAAE